MKAVWRMILLWRFYRKISMEIVWAFHGKWNCQTSSLLILPENPHKKYHSPYCLHTFYRSWRRNIFPNASRVLKFSFYDELFPTRDQKVY